MKYKLIIYEKNNLINKLKSEIDYYKNYEHNINMNMNMNIILPNNTIETNSMNKFSLGIKNNKDKKNQNHIKNSFSLPKKEMQLNNNNLLNYNINDYNNIKTFVNKVDNYNSLDTSKEFPPQIKNNFYTIENNNTDLNNLNNNNKNILLSIDSLKNTDLNKKKILNNIFYRSNSNIKRRDLKLGYQNNELTLDINNDINNNLNTIEANKNYKNIIKNKNFNTYSLNSKNGSYNEINNLNHNEIDVQENDDNSYKKSEKNKKYFTKISSCPSPIYKDKGNKNADSNKKKNNNFSKENFENLKLRMDNLINNLFNLIEIQNKKI